MLKMFKTCLSQVICATGVSLLSMGLVLSLAVPRIAFAQETADCAGTCTWGSNICIGDTCTPMRCDCDGESQEDCGCK